MHRTVIAARFLIALISVSVLLVLTGMVAASPQRSACNDEIVNGNMEADAGWIFLETPATAGYSPTQRHGGARSIRVGITEGNDAFSYSSARQTLTIPSAAISATLSFYVLPKSEEGSLPATAAAVPASAELKAAATQDPASAPQAGDYQYVIIYDEAGEPLQAVIWTRSNLGTWQAMTADMTPYIGRTIMLLFGVYNNGDGARTAMYVDDVSLVACGPAGPLHYYFPQMLNEAPQPTPPPAVCSEGLANGGFESASGWEIRPNPVLAARVPSPVHSGSWSMRTGIPWGSTNVESYSPIQQVVTFPSSLTSAGLSFWHYNAYGDGAAAASALPDQAALPATWADLATATFAADFFYAIGVYPDGAIDWLLVESLDIHSFRQSVVDISRFAGRTVRLQFGTYNNGTGGISRTFVDDASITLCRPANPTPPHLLQTLDLPEDTYPVGVAVQPGGEAVYVAQRVGSLSWLAVVDAQPVLSVATQIPLGSEQTAPNGLALADTTGRVVVALRDAGRAHMVNAASGADVGSIPAAALPDGVAVHDGYGYIANYGGDTLTVFDPSTRGVLATLPVGDEPSHFAVTAGEDLFASMHGNGEIVRLRNGAVVGHIYGITAPYGLAFQPATGRLYVANRGLEHRVTVLDGGSGAVVDSIAIGLEPYVLAINPATGHLFVTCGDRIKVYRTSDKTLLAEIPVPLGAEEGIAFDANYNRVYVTSRSGHALSVIQDEPDAAPSALR